MNKKALILFAHGARDPKWAEPFQRLAQQTQDARPDATVALAFLELMSPRLPELVPTLIAQGCDVLTVVPVFLGQGGHVLRDLPQIIAQLKQAFPEVDIRVSEAVGENAEVQQAMTRYCASCLD